MVDDTIEALEKKLRGRLTINDLQLSVGETAVLQSCDAAFRHALWKSGEFFCLTSIPECCRVTSWKLREYQRELTLTEKNKVSIIDDTPEMLRDQQTSKYFNNKR